MKLNKSALSGTNNPCDYADENGNHVCPYNSESGEGCRYWCGLGVDEDTRDEEE